MKTARTIFFLTAILLISRPLHGQPTAGKFLTVDFKDLGIAEVVSELSGKTGYRFFYDRLQFDSLRITARSDSKTLAVILKQLFSETPFNFAIDEHRKAVFLIKDKFISTDLSIARPITAGVASPFGDGDKTAGTSAQKATLENKLYEIGDKSNSNRPGNVPVSGYVIHAGTGEPVTGATISADHPAVRVTTNRFGYFVMNLPRGGNSLTVKGTGLRDTRRQINVNDPGKLNIEVIEQPYLLKEVVIAAEKSGNVARTSLGMERLDMAAIRQIPTVFGEPDIIRAVLSLPGVKSVGEGAAGFNVRGGATAQNLILFNESTIYNPSHFFGFFSAFNPDVVNDVELYKSSIPAKYGGRLSSVLEISTREGNKKKLAGSAGIGLLTSRLSIEGPILKDRSSFIVGARSTYSNWLLHALPEKSGYKNAKASFSDVNLNVNHQFNAKNSVYFTGYVSHDDSNLGTDTSFAYANRNVSVKWKHQFGSRLYGLFSAGADNYEYRNNSDYDPVSAYKLYFDILQKNLKFDFTQYTGIGHTLNFGFNGIHYKLHPGSFDPAGSKSLATKEHVPAEQALESAVYAGDKFSIGESFSFDVGVRYSLFNNLGPQKVYAYAPGLPVDESNVLDSLNYGNNKLIKTYQRPEFRVSGRWTISENLSVKAGYNSLVQYIHMLSNTAAISPTDIWKLSDRNIRPQYGKQISMGLYKNFRSNTVETSVEVYYKKLSNFLDYKSGATLILNRAIERDVIATRGKAYGAEFLIKKLSGKLNGWIGYTWSRTLLQMDNVALGQPINQGRYYPASYDKPHDFNLTGNHRYSHRFSTSFTVAYSTGRPITLPAGKFNYAGSQRIFFTDRNAFRIPDYFRTDFSLNIDGNHKIRQLLHNSWTIGVYNLTGRKNAYSTYYTTENGKINGYKLTIFGNPVPFINYTIKF